MNVYISSTNIKQTNSKLPCFDLPGGGALDGGGAGLETVDEGGTAGAGFFASTWGEKQTDTLG